MIRTESDEKFFWNGNVWGLCSWKADSEETALDLTTREVSVFRARVVVLGLETFHVLP